MANRHLVLVAVLLWTSMFVPEPQAAEAKTEAVFKSLRSQARVQAALEQIRREDARTLKEQIEIAETPAPSHKEQMRASDFVRLAGTARPAADDSGSGRHRRWIETSAAEGASLASALTVYTPLGIYLAWNPHLPSLPNPAAAPS